MNMTWDETVELLAFAAVYDQRKADSLDVKAWHLAAQAERWTAPAATRVVGEHYARGADRPRITPAAISDRLRALRGRAAETFEAPRIPDGLPNHEYPAWLRACLATHVDAQLDQWAGTGDEPTRTAPRTPITIRTLPELIAAAPAHARPALQAGAKTVTQRRVPRVKLDATRREEARAELDATRPTEAAS